ncbi:MAG: histidine phosphatase family protein [Candidatus Promineifilaceae bacterium]
MHLYLVRHGESTMNLPDHADRTVRDVPLTELGHRQAEALGKWLPGRILQPTIIYCSTMRRTRETGAYISESLNMPLVFDDRIREIGNNNADHAPVEFDDHTTYNEFWASERPFSPITTSLNGETMMHFRARIGIFMHELLEKHADDVVMLVIHGFVIDAIIDLVYNVGPYRSVEVWTSNTGLSHLQYVNRPTRESWRLYSQNRIEHLIGIGGLGLTAGGPNAPEDGSVKESNE